MTLCVDPRLLETFEVVARELHFARAARELRLSQPTVTLQVRRLEQQLGFKLFERSSRHVELTPPGSRLLQGVGPGLQRLQAAIDESRAIAGVRMTLTVAVEMDVGECWLAAIREFARDNDDVRITVMRAQEPGVLAAVQTGQASAALHWSPPRLSRLLGQEIADVDVRIAMREGHPLAGRSAVTRSDLRRFPLVLFDRLEAPGIWGHYIDLLFDGDRAAVEIHGVSSVDRAQAAMLDAVRANDRLTLVRGEHPLAADTDGLTIRDLSPPLTLPLFWSHPAQRRNGLSNRLKRHLVSLAEAPKTSV